VDHPLSGPDALVRPWRIAAYVAAAIAAVELLLLLVIGGGTLMGVVSDRLQLAAQQRALAPPPDTKPSARRTAPSPAAKLPRSRTVIAVLNGNGRTGAAAEAATRVRSRGYKIGTVGNAPRQVSRSLVMYKPGFSGEGVRLARDLQIKRAGPLDGIRTRELGRAQVVYVLGS
jgi:LytR cell envelope-related transcriptional attenuator